MENEIKVGEYVRTKNGEIHKVEDIEDLRIHIQTEKIMFRSWVEDYYGTHKEDRFIVKHSKNIIDLIEVGDYVNGQEVTEIKEWNSSKDGYFRYAVTCHYEIIRADEIKTIVTKEMMDSISYKVKQEEK